MKSEKTAEDGAPPKRVVLSIEAPPTWSLPDGRALAEFALASGFLAPQLMGSDPESRSPVTRGPERISEVDEAGSPPAPPRTRPK